MTLLLQVMRIAGGWRKQLSTQANTSRRKRRPGRMSGQDPGGAGPPPSSPRRGGPLWRCCLAAVSFAAALAALVPLFHDGLLPLFRAPIAVHLLLRGVAWRGRAQDDRENPQISQPRSRPWVSRLLYLFLPWSTLCRWMCFEG